MMEGDILCYPNLNSSCKKPTHPYTEAMLIYVLLSIISIITVILNAVVIISISHFRKLHTPTNLLLLSLAVSDLLVGLLLMPVEIIYIESCWFLGDIVCSFYYVIDYVITSASVANMVLISIDRYIAICNPMTYHIKVTQQRVEVCITLCWLAAILYRIAILYDHLQNPGMSNSCSGECVVVINYISGAIDVVCTFILPILIIIVLYLRVFMVAVTQAHAMRRQIASVQNNEHTTTVNKTELKAAKTLGIVVIVFLCCFCPYYYPSLTGEDTSIDASSVDVEIWLAHFNSCLNPVIYAFFYPWFRKSMKLILTLQILKPGSSNANIL